jgi:hypothetical protein
MRGEILREPGLAGIERLVPCRTRAPPCRGSNTRATSSSRDSCESSPTVRGPAATTSSGRSGLRPSQTTESLCAVTELPKTDSGTTYPARAPATGPSASVNKAKQKRASMRNKAHPFPANAGAHTLPRLARDQTQQSSLIRRKPRTGTVLSTRPDAVTDHILLRGKNLRQTKN